MNYKLLNVNTTNLIDLKKVIELGSKFIVFNYRIGLGAVSLLRLSPAILIKNEQEFEQYKKKYNRLNFFLGPWFIFSGPFLTYKAYKTNQNGGLDVTNDIMVNLTQESLLIHEVDIETIHDIFSRVDKSNRKNILKAIEKTNFSIVQLKKVYIGLFINVDEYQEPHFVIGIELKKDKELNDEHIRNNLYKYFYKHVKFEIIRINEKTEYIEKLIEQGELIYTK